MRNLLLKYLGRVKGLEGEAKGKGARIVFFTKPANQAAARAASVGRAAKNRQPVSRRGEPHLIRRQRARQIRWPDGTLPQRMSLAPIPAGMEFAITPKGFEANNGVAAALDQR
jgi:hypothetical protein